MEIILQVVEHNTRREYTMEIFNMGQITVISIMHTTTNNVLWLCRDFVWMDVYFFVSLLHLWLEIFVLWNGLENDFLNFFFENLVS